MEIHSFLDFNKVIDMMESSVFPDVEIMAFPRDLGDGVCSCRFVAHEYSLGLWCSNANITLHEFAFNKIPKQVHPVDQITSVEMTDKGFKITFKGGYLYKDRPLKEININLIDITKSTLS